MVFAQAVAINALISMAIIPNFVGMGRLSQVWSKLLTERHVTLLVPRTGDVLRLRKFLRGYQAFERIRLASG